MTKSISNSNPSPADVASYYDQTLGYRLQDYVFGNERIEAAIALIDSTLTSEMRKILDVGCGLGIAAATLAQRHPQLTIHGVDISANTISAARQLFGSDRLLFDISTMQQAPRLAPYDLVSLLDVHEHIPRDAWSKFHSAIGDSLTPCGTVVVTTPSPMYQEYLRNEKPQALQIVDESIHPQDLLAMARALGGELVSFRYVSIWRENDYSHAIIRRGITSGSLPQARARSLANRINSRLLTPLLRSFESRRIRKRRRHAFDCLHIDVIPR